jgi:hypothetical protein
MVAVSAKKGKKSDTLAQSERVRAMLQAHKDNTIIIRRFTAESGRLRALAVRVDPYGKAQPRIKLYIPHHETNLRSRIKVKMTGRLRADETVKPVDLDGTATRRLTE